MSENTKAIDEAAENVEVNQSKAIDELGTQVREEELEDDLTLDDLDIEDEELNLDDLDLEIEGSDQEESETVTEAKDVDKEPTAIEETEEETEDDDAEPEENFPELDLENVQPIEHETKSAVGNSGEASDVRIVNTPKSGKRIVLKLNALEELETEDTLEVGLMGDVLVMTKEGISDVKYNLKEDGNTGIIYNTKLITDITTALKLDFSNRSTVGLGEVKYVTKDGKKFLMARK